MTSNCRSTSTPSSRKAGKRCWKPVQAGCPRAGAIPKPVTQGRLHRPAPTDRPPESTAGNTNSPRPPAGAPGKPTAAPAASPAARGGYRTSTAPAHGGLPGAGTAAIDSAVLARSSRSDPIRFRYDAESESLSQRWARADAGEGVPARFRIHAIPETDMHDPERDISDIPLSQLELSPDNVRKTPADDSAFTELKASIAAHGLLEKPDCPFHGTRHRLCRALRGDRRRAAAWPRCRRWPPRARWTRTTPCPAA